MQTKTLIQASANVIRITELNIGNVVKLLKKNDSYGSSDMDVYYGVVTNLFNNGDGTFVELLMFKHTYGEITGSVELYTGTKDLPIFPATIEEVKDHLGRAVRSLRDKVARKERELRDEKEALERAEAFVSGQTSRALTEASFVETTQADYDAQKAIAAPTESVSVKED